MSKEYTFFWSGPFSQWYPSKFTVGELTFNCAEQFMMYSKATFFGDKETAELIMQSTNPKEQKALGRKVKNFDAEKWNDVAKAFVYTGNMEKFNQNPKLKQILLDTDGTTLVEASPYDKIWGIGLDEKTAKVTPVEKWPGTNWLGEVLTSLRINIIHHS